MASRPPLGFRITGQPITVSFVRGLSARLGQPVHAGSDIRRREMLLDAELRRDRRELARIFIHELFHFAWVRLGNPLRRAYERLLDREWTERARGELGWSAEVLKQRLTAADRRTRSRRWREYVCESFCDAGAWKFSGLQQHEEWTLAGRYRVKRGAFLVLIIERGELRV